MRAHFNTSATTMVDIYLYIHPVQVPQWLSNFEPEIKAKFKEFSEEIKKKKKKIEITGANRFTNEGLSKNFQNI